MENEMTLEQWGTELAKEFGYSTDNPRVQERITETVRQIREQVPGKSDQELIQTVGPVIKQSLQTAKSPSFSLENYKAQQQQIAQTYSPEAEQKLQEQVRRRNLVTQAARAVSTGERLAATPAQQQELQRGYEERMKDNLAPLRDWQQRKQSALKGLEDMAKVGEIEDRQLRIELNRLGVEQQLEERKNRQIQAAAENDAASATSEAMRFLAKKYAPQLAEQLGDNFSRVTAAQLKNMLPALEKEYLKQLEIDQKKLDREGKIEEAKIRAGAAGQSAAARIEAARIAADARTRAAATAAAARTAAGGAAAAPKPLKPSEQLAFEKEEGKVRSDLRQAENTVSNFNRLETIIQGGLTTGPVVGSETVGRIVRLASSDRQQADSIVKNIVADAAKTFGANPTEGERRYIEQANSVLQLDDPLPRLKELRATFEQLVSDRQARLQRLQQIREGGAQPAPAAPAPAASSITPEDFNKRWATLPKGGSLVGPDGKTYTKK